MVCYKLSERWFLWHCELARQVDCLYVLRDLRGKAFDRAHGCCHRFCSPVEARIPFAFAFTGLECLALADCGD